MIHAARETVGTPWVHQGRLLGQALDCVGVVVHVCRRLGLRYLDATGYGRTPAAGLLEAKIAEQPALLAVGGFDEALPGDLLVLRFAREPQHVAILTQAATLIHSWEAVGRCCEHALTAKWARRVVSAHRFVGHRGHPQ